MSLYIISLKPLGRAKRKKSAMPMVLAFYRAKQALRTLADPGPMHVYQLPESAYACWYHGLLRRDVYDLMLIAHVYLSDEELLEAVERKLAPRLVPWPAPIDRPYAAETAGWTLASLQKKE